MKYVRVVLAVPDSELDTFDEALDVFIEETDAIGGAYVSAPYGDRTTACGPDWRSKP